MNALADPRVADYLNENFICTYLKVGTFKIVNGQKQGGNVASYFCLYDGGVVHAVPGQVGADKLLSESRFAYEIRKSAVTFSTDLTSGNLDMKKYREKMARAHAERYHADGQAWSGNRKAMAVPMQFPQHASQQAQAHWMLASNTLPKWDKIYGFVWTRILREKLSDEPVLKQ